VRLSVRGILSVCLLILPASVWAHDLVLTTGYAASEKPSMGTEVSSSDFSSGGGYVVGVRVDFDASPRIWLAPSILYWDNITGGQSGAENSHYAQVQVGARVLVHTWSMPTLYLGAGADFAATQGVVKAGRVDPYYNKGTVIREFDGEAPVGILMAGFKGQAPLGLGVLAEVAYQFGLDEPVGKRWVGPASVILLQIGVFLRDERSSR
jgi:hypothetical protein